MTRPNPNRDMLLCVNCDAPIVMHAGDCLRWSVMMFFDSITNKWRALESQSTVRTQLADLRYVLKTGAGVALIGQRMRTVAGQQRVECPACQWIQPVGPSAPIRERYDPTLAVELRDGLCTRGKSTRRIEYGELPLTAEGLEARLNGVRAAVSEYVAGADDPPALPMAMTSASVLHASRRATLRRSRDRLED